MKRMKTIMSVLFISILPLSLALGQEKKNEQKVKVIIADKSGTKVVIDTTFAEDAEVDSIILKEGNVIYIGKDDSESDKKPGKQIRVIAHVDENGGNNEQHYVYVNSDKVVGHIGDEKIAITVNDDDFDSDLDRTKYVIAKNGITVSIEGDDEEKVKELAQEIEKKLDIDKEESGTTVKETDKKTVRKK